MAEISDMLQRTPGVADVNAISGHSIKSRSRPTPATAERDKDIGGLYVRSNDGKMVPLRTLISVTTVTGPQLVPRYNQFTAVRINREAAPSSSEAMTAMEGVAERTLPDGYGYDWSGMSFQERRTNGQAPFLFALAS